MKSYSVKETKKIIGDIFATDSDPDTIFRRIADEVLPKLMTGDDKEQQWAKDQIHFRSDDAVAAMGLINHYHLIATADKQYAPLLLSVTRQIEKEYECSTVVEKILAEQIAGAHIKIIDYSRRFEEWCGNGQPTKVEITKFLGMLGKQIDRASRQLHTAIIILRQIKQPTLSVNINTKNIFTAQNQQINSNQTKP